MAPHQADDLDVILLGHSIGGILAADVALLQQGTKPKHRILGLISFDTPFLGLHPRIIPDGIKSLFSKDTPEEKLLEEQESLGLEPAYRPSREPKKPSPNYNRPWRNDKRFQDRGLVDGLKHFVQKKVQEDHIAKSVFDRILSPAKFANCVNNYSELRQRYQRLKELDNDELSPDRVRFINYYTSSSGRQKTKSPECSGEGDKETTPSPSQDSQGSNQAEGNERALSELSLADSSPTSVDQPRNQSVSGSVSESLSTSDSGSTPKTPKPLKEQRFILMPSSHWKYDDNAGWSPVAMGEMDAVVAHQSMFIPTSKHYDYLFGDTVAIIEQWIQNDLSRRVVQEESAEKEG